MLLCLNWVNCILTMKWCTIIGLKGWVRPPSHGMKYILIEVTEDALYVFRQWMFAKEHGLLVCFFGLAIGLSYCIYIFFLGSHCILHIKG